MKKKNILLNLLCFALLIFVLVPNVVSADSTDLLQLAQVDLKGDIMRQVEVGAEAAELGTPQDPRLIAATIIKILLSLLGTIFLALTVYAGYLWLTSHGEEERVERARKILKRSIIGIIIVLLSYSITLFVGGALGDIIFGDW